MRPKSSGLCTEQSAAVKLLLLWLCLHAVAIGQTCDVKADEEIIFFPATGHRVEGGETWELEVRGCVFEPEKRPAAIAALAAGLQGYGVRLTPAERAVLRDRARLFMADHERGKRVVIRAGEQIYQLGKSGRDGVFSGVIRLPMEQENPRVTQLTIEAVLPAKDKRRFRGTGWLVPETGVTVVTDIDDTIKETCVRDRRAMLRNSFLEPFRPIPGMAGLYAELHAKEAAHFCYVSASPMQFYLPLAGFVLSNGFPAGSFSLKQVRWKDKSLLDLFADPEAYKLRAIEPMLRCFPKRRFVLVGDSGERDPETYATLARRYPRQITRILIRDVTGEPADSPRYRHAFRDLPAGLWQVFREPAEVGVN